MYPQIFITNRVFNLVKIGDYLCKSVDKFLKSCFFRVG
jgi:hypothetical protein